MPTASISRAPRFTLMGGRRQVTGKDEPAIKGIFNSRAVLYIHFASSQFHERCLSENTGTTRPVRRNTATVSSKKRRRGYLVWPVSEIEYWPCSPINRTPSTAK